MKIWKLILGFFGLIGGLFAANAVKSKEVKELGKAIKENKKKEKEVEKEIKVLQENKTENKKEITNLKRKLTRTKNEVKKMETAYESDDVESAEEFLRKFSKSK
jgi:predicted  nucleic acid-binding Zn-ribbon protein